MRPSRHLRQHLARLLSPLWLATAAAIVSPPASAQSADTPPAGYTQCAGEYEVCRFSGTTNVIYGARSTWTSPRSFSSSTYCGNAVFGDPLSGTIKSCYYQTATSTPPTTPPTPPAPPASSPSTPPSSSTGPLPAGFTFCAGEHLTCSFSGSADVVYGANTTWTNPRSFTGGTACNNAIFGDPVSGTIKSCYYKPASAATPQFALGLSLSGSGSVAFPSGSPCTANCSKTFDSGASVTLVATAASGYTFSGWGGACAGTSSSCVVSMTSAKNVSASFSAAPTTKTLSLTLTGGGGVGFSDGGSCATSCNKTVATGSSLVLAASAAEGFTFGGWGGACSGTASTCTVAMDSAKSVSVTFTSAPPPAAGASAPRVFFSDLDSGPNTGGLNNKGVFVSVHGKNFGATRGASVVKFGGGAVDNYLSWSDTKVVVQLGASAKTGDITVVNASGAVSNGVPFTVRPGSIYFVSPNGSGNGSIASPMSPSAAYSAIAPGATIYFRGGAYTGVYGWTSYSDYSYVLGGAKGGASGQPVAFAGYPGETATFSGHKGIFSFRDNDSPAPTADYVTIANLRLVCQETCIHSAANTGLGVTKSGAKAIRVVGNVMSATYTWNTATGLVSVGNDGWRILGNELKDTGTTPPINNNHAIYVQVGASDVDIGWNHLHDLRMGHLIQVHTDIPSKHEDVRIHDNLLTAADKSQSRGINIGNTAPGSWGAIYGNVLSNLGQDFSAIAIYSGDWKIYNNTMHNINAYTGMLWLNSQSSKPTAVITNNIFYSDGSSPYIGLVNGTSTAQVQVSNNLYFNKGGAPSFDKAPVVGDPSFVNAAAGNFRLQGASPAVNKGSAAVGTIVTRDADGTARPQQGAFDIGAFEYAP